MKESELEKSRKKRREEENSQDEDGEESKSDDEEDQESEDGTNKWDYIEHNGVTFHGHYIPSGVNVKYQGDSFELLPEEQQLIYYWYQSRNAAQITNPTFKSNFLSQFMNRFKNKKFELFSFDDLYIHFEKDKKQKDANQAYKLELKNKKLEQSQKYGYAIVDNLLQKVSNTKIEGPSLLKGRGDHPLTGTLKARIYPEDVTINISEKAPIPICPMRGHSWGTIIHNHQVTWLASYKDTALKKSHKYVYLAPNSVFKSSNDIKKYDKARNLKNSIVHIRKDYYSKLEGNDPKQQQLGTATYLIDTLALRVGNEKSKDQADTVGCCSLRVEHITLQGNNKITLNFLGKDSIEYKNTVGVAPVVYKCLDSFLKSKEPKDNIFDKIDAQVLNDYLRGLMQGLTAKVFRTYNASTTLQQQLNKKDLTGLTMDQKKDKYQQSITQVAILCNHQKTVSKKAEQNSKKAQNDLKTKAKYVDDLKEHLDEFKGKKKPTRKSQTIQLQNGKQYKLQFPDNKQQAELLLSKQRQRLLKEQKLFEKKQKNKQIATGTSKTNYNDPRISVAWCKKNEVKIQKIFNKALLSKFFWAMSVEESYEF